jgi:hypothetical protein
MTNETEHARKTDTFHAAALLFEDTLTGYADRPGTIRRPLQGVRVG